MAAYGVARMELNEYQRLAALTDQRPGETEQALAFPLLGLASEVGALVNQYKKRVRDGDAHALFSERAAEELGDVLWYVSNLTGKLGITLEEIATINLRRTQERWPTGDGDTPTLLLDDGFPEAEQLPRTATVTFVESTEDGRRRVRIYFEGEQLGDPLSDMAWEQDDYRFHDAFHLAYAAVLGWSPITRAMFARQRDSDPQLREIEDSGRAKVVEEAVAVLVFEYARQERFLEGVEHVDFSLLQTVTSMTSRLQVRVRTAREWETAILKSFDVWRNLRDHGGGSVKLDLRGRAISFEPPETPDV